MSGSGYLNTTAKRILSVYNSTKIISNIPSSVATTFTGTYEDVINYESVSIIINSDDNSATNGLVIYFAISPSDTAPITRVFTHQSGQNIYDIPIQSRYLRITYTPTSGNFSVTTYLNPLWVKESSPYSGTNLTDPLGGHTDIFGRIRTAELVTLADIKHIQGIGINNIKVAQSLSGGATATLDTYSPVVHMNVSTNNDLAIRQSRIYTQYQTGKSLLFYMTGIINAASNQAGSKSRIGYFDVDNGVFFEYDGSLGMRVVLRSKCTGAVVDQAINQSNWNIDTMDGMGMSGVTIDWTKALIFTINLAWLGVGIIKFGVFYSGTYYPIHIFWNTELTTTYTATCNLPVRYEILSSGGTGQLDMICVSVNSESGYNLKSIPLSLGTATKTVTSTETYLMGIRLRGDYRNIITLNNFAFVCTNTGTMEIKIYLYLSTPGATYPLSGATFANANTDNSAMEYAVNGSWTKYTPIQVYQTFISSSDTVARIDLSNSDSIMVTAGIGKSSDFLSDLLVVTAKRLDGTQDRDVAIALGWLETL